MYIIEEGGEGGGKSEMQKRISNWLQNHGYKVLCVSEPGGTWIGKLIRKVLLNWIPLGGFLELLLFSLDRLILHLFVILPALAMGKVVISDRSWYSTMAYQGYSRGQSLSLIRFVSFFATMGLKPDLVLYFHVTPEVGLQRRGKNLNRLDKEKGEFHRKVSEGYKILLQTEPNWHCIDADVDKESVWAQIERVLVSLT